ncbi:MAG: A-macroglobulin complement component, partial [Lentisphaeria bacterium]|nr:A-macroglobulin complement component [Lentisphaeria bacterium]
AAGAEYRLVVRNEQTLAEREFALPAVVAGAVISAEKPAYDFGEAIALTIRATDKAPKQPGSVVLKKRDEEIAKIQLSAGQDRVEIAAGEKEGVLIATLYAKDGSPMAERLVFRRPKFRINTTIEGLDKDYTPGDKVTLTIATTDDSGNPVSANVGITITDASVKDLVDKRDIAPRLPAMVYLENEVRSFADAGDYFNPEDPLASVKIDLLLGTQGWRRFVEVRNNEIAQNYADALRRILAPKVTIRPPLVYAYDGVGGAVNGGNAARGAGRFFKRLFGAEVKEAAVADMMVVEEEAMPVPAAMGAVDDDNVRFEMGADPFDIEAPVEAMEANAILAEVPEADMVMADMAPAQLAAKARIAPAPRRRRIWIREYAHKARENRRPGDRVDFTETVYWAASKQTDPRTGKAEISFELPDTVGAFQVMADSFADNGALGEYTSELKSVQPFYAEIKLPLFMSVGDQAIVPITLVNATKEPLNAPNLVLECSEKARIIEKPVFNAGDALAPGERRALFARIEALSAGDVSLKVRAVAGGNSDAVTRGLTVVSRMFPFSESAGASVGKDSPLVFKVTIPAEVENGSQKVAAQVYASPAATMEAALNALLRQPHGCFEQTSSTNYPLVMAQQYFLSHAGCDTAKIKKAQELLDEGYKKLVSFECSKKGYEWFGENPGHEALSAYGLMEFADMAKVMPVDQGMIQETRTWLMNRRDGNGGFLRNERSLDSFGRAPANTTDAYIVWSLLESGEKAETLKKEIEAVAKKAASSEDDYLKALAANILFLAGDKAGAEKFADMLVADQQKDGTMAHPGPTITCSGDVSQNLECTSLAALAWVRCGAKYTLNTECAMKMLAAACEGGKFGSTQSTVLVLKAINAYDASFAKPKAPGSVQLWLDGKAFGTPVAFDADSKGILALPDCGLALTPGEHTLEIRLAGESELTSSIVVNGMTALPKNGGNVLLETALSKTEAIEGEPLQLLVKVTNASQEEANMPLAVVAIPGGLEVQHDQLKELVKAGRIAAYEVIDNAVVLYWRGLKAAESLQVPLAMTAVIPGEYTAAASRAYLYYSDNEKQYKPGTAIKITPRQR